MALRFMFFAALFGALAAPATAQIKFGLRAGIGVTSISGPSELDDAGAELEQNRATVRLAAAATVRIPFSKRFGFSTELAFTQKGAYRRYDGTSYLQLPNSGQTFEGHHRVQAINVTNGYLEVPALFYGRFFKEKVQLEVGASAGALISSRAFGILKYTDSDHPTQLVEFDLNYRYGTDDAGATAQVVTTGFNATTITTKTGKIDQTTVSYPNSIGAYYFNGEKQGNYFRTLDFNLQAGISYYFTDGLRFGTRFFYGLTDATNNYYDVSLYKLDANNKPIQRADRDINVGGLIFLGLQF